MGLADVIELWTNEGAYSYYVCPKTPFSLERLHQLAVVRDVGALGIFKFIM